MFFTFCIRARSPSPKPPGQTTHRSCNLTHNTQVKETSLVQHTVEGLAARAGGQLVDRVTAVVCPWKWSMPWQQSGGRRATDEQQLQ